MWKNIWLFSALLAFSMVSLASESIEGKYQHKKEIHVVTESRSQCEESGGSWSMADESCLLEAADEVIIKKTKRDYKITITTIGANYHICEYSNIAQLDGNKLTSSMKSEEFNPKSGLMENVTCKIQVDFNKSKLSVMTNEHCQGFCGVNADMNVIGLKKVNKG